MIAQKLSEAWGQQVYVENVPGGGEIVGTGQPPKRAPDGYTTLFATGAFTLNPSLHSKLPYDTLKDFAPITLVASGPHVLTVHPSVPANERAGAGRAPEGQPRQVQLRVVRRQHPAAAGRASCSSSSSVSIWCTCRSMAAARPSPRRSADIRRSRSRRCRTPRPNIKDGKLRALGVTSARRLAEFPDVPTMAEAGVSDLVSGSMQGILAAGRHAEGRSSTFGIARSPPSSRCRM